MTDLTTQPVTTTSSYNQNSGSSSSTTMAFPDLAALGGTLYFANGDPTHGTELWSTYSATKAPGPRR